MRASPDRAAQLAKFFEATETGEFPWSGVGARHIHFLNLVEQRPGPLRGEYDDLRIGNVPQVGNEWGMKLLHAILKLGGKLSSEEPP